MIVSPPSFEGTVSVPLSIDRVPYRAVSTGSLSANATLGEDVSLVAQVSYTGSMLIQQYTRLELNSELDTEEMRRTPGFWLVNLSAELPLGRRLSLLAAVDNVTNRIQDDLGDPTTDHNWGPLAGRSWRLGLKARLDR